MQELDRLLAAADTAISAASDQRELDALRVRYLGKKGEVTALLKQLGKLPPEARPAAGQAVNAADRKSVV